MVEREYSYGIYMFKDKKTNKIDYIGLDSHIDRRERIKNHYHPSRYSEQPFHRALQKNPDRFKPFVYCEVDTWEEMSQLEFDLINLYRPRFNYQQGGCDRSLINKEFKYTVSKAGTNKGKQNYQIISVDKKQLVSSFDYSFLSDLCEKLNNNELTPDEVKIINRKNGILNNSKANTSSGFYRVYKMINKNYKKGWTWVYQYYDENKKRKAIRRVDLFELEKAVKSRDLPWEIIDIQNATNTVKQFIGF